MLAFSLLSIVSSYELVIDTSYVGMVMRQRDKINVICDINSGFGTTQVGIKRAPPAISTSVEMVSLLKDNLVLGTEQGNTAGEWLILITLR